MAPAHILDPAIPRDNIVAFLRQLKNKVNTVLNETN